MWSQSDDFTFLRPSETSIVTLTTSVICYFVLGLCKSCSILALMRLVHPWQLALQQLFRLPWHNWNRRRPKTCSKSSNSCSYGNHAYSSSSSRFPLDSTWATPPMKELGLDNHWWWPSCITYHHYFISVTIPTFISIFIRFTNLAIIFPVLIAILTPAVEIWEIHLGGSWVRRFPPIIRHPQVIVFSA